MAGENKFRIESGRKFDIAAVGVVGAVAIGAQVTAIHVSNAARAHEAEADMFHKVMEKWEALLSNSPALRSLDEAKSIQTDLPKFFAHEKALAKTYDHRRILLERGALIGAGVVILFWGDIIAGTVCDGRNLLQVASSRSCHE